MKKGDRPSEYFLGTILRAYGRAMDEGVPATPERLWSYICLEAVHERGAFEAMFEWDSRKGRQNRIGTIIDVIGEGWVPCMGRKRLDILYCGGREGRIVVEVDDVAGDLPGVLHRHANWGGGR